MKSEKKSVEEKFYLELSKHIGDGDVSIKEIYTFFPKMNKKTISWRLYALVQEGKLYRPGHGYYAINQSKHSDEAAGYEYLQKKSQIVYEILLDYGFQFYITGLDSLVGEILHIPENYPVLIVVEQQNLVEVQQIINEKGLIAVTEKDGEIIENNMFKNKVDVILLQGKDLSLSINNIAKKEKGFVDLYYAVTRIQYGVSIPELSRIYENLQRNKSITKIQLKSAAKDRRISMEMDWLIQLNKVSNKTLEFMRYQTRGGYEADQ